MSLLTLSAIFMVISYCRFFLHKTSFGLDNFVNVFSIYIIVFFYHDSTFSCRGRNKNLNSLQNMKIYIYIHSEKSIAVHN